MSNEENKGIWVVMETKNGEVSGTSLETLAAAKSLSGETGENVAAVFLSGNLKDGSLESVLCFGTDAIFQPNAFEEWDASSASHALGELCEKHRPAVILAAGTIFGKELLARLSAILSLGLVSDAVGLKLHENRIAWTCRAYSGNVLYDCVIEGGFPKLVTVRRGAFKKPVPDQSGKGNIIEEKAMAVSQKGISLVESVDESLGLVNLEEAGVIVSGGRGMGGKEGFEILYELADVLGGAVGSTRPPIESGWISRPHQIGQSGKTVKPGLCISCGISGATQHVSGMRDSGFIVAVNRDEDAPIFDISNIGIVGNAMEIIPALIDELKRIKS